MFFFRLSITAPAPLNGFNLNGSRSRGGGDESFPSFEELVLDAGETRESQQSGLKLNENKDANTDSNNSIHSKIEKSTFEQNGRHCFFDTSWIFTTNSKAGYDPANPR